MTGCIFKRKLPSGTISWGYSLDGGKDQNGRRKQIFKSGFKLKAEAAAALRQRLAEKDSGDLVTPDPQTFSGFAEEWLREYGPRRCTLKTLERYRQLVSYLTPHFGTTRLQDLTALMIERVLNHLRDAGGKDRRPLSVKTVRHIAGVANVILKKAIKLKLLKSNPMEGVELPPLPRREAQAIDSDKVDWYLEAARAHGLYELLTFCAGTGCRRGEALALGWSDVDLDSGTVRIARSLEQTRGGLRVKSTKTDRARVVSLPTSLVAMLRLHREHQEENRRLFGDDYRRDLDLVFAGPDGDYLKPDSITAKASLIARKAGLGKGISLHSLRHSHATALLSAGASLPTVSKRLGHANVHTTALVYSHSLPQDDLAAAELWDARFLKASEKTAKAKVS